MFSTSTALCVNCTGPPPTSSPPLSSSLLQSSSSRTPRRRVILRKVGDCGGLTPCLLKLPALLGVSAACVSAAAPSPPPLACRPLSVLLTLPLSRRDDLPLPVLVRLGPGVPWLPSLERLFARELRVSSLRLLNLFAGLAAPGPFASSLALLYRLTGLAPLGSLPALSEMSCCTPGLAQTADFSVRPLRVSLLDALAAFPRSEGWLCMTVPLPLPLLCTCADSFP